MGRRCRRFVSPTAAEFDDSGVASLVPKTRLASRKPLAALLASGGLRDGSHDEDRVAERVQQVERPHAPILVSRRAQDSDLGAPLTIVGIRIIFTSRDTQAFRPWPSIGLSSVSLIVPRSRPISPLRLSSDASNTTRIPNHSRRTSLQPSSPQPARSVSLVPCGRSHQTDSAALLARKSHCSGGTRTRFRQFG
jgi:hypothetical protein